MGSRSNKKWEFRRDIDGYQTTEALIESISDFSDCVKYVWDIKWREGRDALRKQYPEYIEEEFPWFRGVDNIDYHLMPGLYRLSQFNSISITEEQKKQIINIAEDIREEFRRRGEYLLKEFNRRLEDGELYEVMQHYAVPTRLLDWTEGALIALYFAIRMLAFKEKEPSQSAPHVPCVWMLNPSWLNDNAKSIKSPLPVYLTESAMEKYHDTDEKARVYLDEKKLPEDPIAVYPHYLDPKMRAQKSVFTLHGSIPNAFNQICLSNSGAEICKIKINPEKADDIAKELRLAGITESNIFPELKGLANEIRNEKGTHFSFDR
jgi:hypothetical protein